MKNKKKKVFYEYIKVAKEKKVSLRVNEILNITNLKKKEFRRHFRYLSEFLAEVFCFLALETYKKFQSNNSNFYFNYNSIFTKETSISIINNLDNRFTKYGLSKVLNIKGIEIFGQEMSIFIDNLFIILKDIFEEKSIDQFDIIKLETFCLIIYTLMGVNKNNLFLSFNLQLNIQKLI